MMTWYSKKISSYGFNSDPSTNIKKLMELHKTNQLGIYINTNSIKHDKFTILESIITEVGPKLLNKLYITTINQYYYKLLRIIKNTILIKLSRNQTIRRSSNKQLRHDYKNGSNNIIAKFVENQNLGMGCSTPVGMEHIPGQIIRNNNKIIKEVFSNKK